MKVELVAAEPLVLDPVWLAFDQRGQLFVAEYSDYPTGNSNPDGPPLSKIVLLQDTDQDGRMDRRHVFADQLDFVHSFMPYRDGLLVGAQTQILYLRDTDGDYRADVREVLFSGFKPAHPQMQIGCPVWGIDNWIYWTYGAGDVQRLPNLFGSAPSAPQSLRRDFRFHPLTLEFGPASGFGQFGHTVDSRGHRFFCTNRNPIITAPILPTDFQRQPQILFPIDQYDVGPAGGDALVYPLVAMKSNYLSHAGTHTAACGTTAYTGAALGEDYSDNVFVCEPIGHLITRSIVGTRGSQLSAHRARDKADFLASTDTWFRPASLANGPDGALYVADMYRLWVEHPKFLPPEIADKLDWRAGEDRGRIWRIVSEKPSAKLDFVAPETTQDLVQLLTHENGWQRMLGQRLLVERQATQAAPAVRGLLSQTISGPIAQHALWTLDGLGELESVDVTAALHSPDAVVRQDAVKLSRRMIGNESIRQSVFNAANDLDAGVRLQVALALGDVPVTEADKTSDESTVAQEFAQILIASQDDEWVVTAVLSSSADRTSQIFAAIVSALESDLIRPTTPMQRVVKELASAAAASGNLHTLGELLSSLASAQPSGAWWQYAALTGLASGLPRQPAVARCRSLAQLLQDPPPQLAESVSAIQPWLTTATERAVTQTVATADRVSAIELASYLPRDRWHQLCSDLLLTAQPVEIQLSVVQCLRRLGDTTGAQLLLERWSQLGPQVRVAALSFLLLRSQTAQLALSAMQRGQISPAMTSIDQRAILLAHPDAAVKQLATEVFGIGVSPDRQQVARQYAAAVEMKGNVENGQKLFQSICAACHRFNGLGHEVGPDISDTRNRSREALLHDILDPNQKLEPKYAAYQVLTVDGAVIQGILVAENAEAIVLQMPDGKQQNLLRSDLEQFQSLGKSLMPEGIERLISPSEMADLLDFLKTP